MRHIASFCQILASPSGRPPQWRALAVAPVCEERRERGGRRREAGEEGEEEREERKERRGREGGEEGEERKRGRIEKGEGWRE